ncbi:SLOG family protein [Deinococcus petrolearius]|uniref:SLOG family protein n=1 Tax=Deinococcus petrolearius TaxID=1751295 RepID=A0ABW1DNK1_9DEIO
MTTSMTMLRPSAPEIRNLLQGRFVVAGTGHRPDKLGGYPIPAGTGAITSFRGAFAFLSNFHALPVKFEGVTYATVEAAFQAAKTLDLRIRRRIAQAKTPAAARALGRDRRLQLREDWEKVKVGIMEDLLRQKFQDPTLARSLMATEGRSIQEHNTWGDQFWGISKGSGQNMLGLLLMKVRQDLLMQNDFPLVQDPEQVLIELAVKYLRRLRDGNPSLIVISGMALGWDTALALAARQEQIPYVAALPFPGQASRWPEASQQCWRELVRDAALVVAVGSDNLADADIRSAMQWRNEFMVDQCDLMLACYDGSFGGTHNCVQDAEAQNRTVINTYGDWLSMSGLVQDVTLEVPRTDGVQIRYEERELTVYPIQDSVFWLGGYEVNGVRFTALIHGEQLQAYKAQATASDAVEAIVRVTHKKFGEGLVLSQTGTPLSPLGVRAEVQFSDAVRMISVSHLQF